MEQSTAAPPLKEGPVIRYYQGKPCRVVDLSGYVDAVQKGCVIAALFLFVPYLMKKINLWKPKEEETPQGEPHVRSESYVNEEGNDTTKGGEDGTPRRAPSLRHVYTSPDDHLHEPCRICSKTKRQRRNLSHDVSEGENHSL